MPFPTQREPWADARDQERHRCENTHCRVSIKQQKGQDAHGAPEQRKKKTKIEPQPRQDDQVTELEKWAGPACAPALAEAAPHSRPSLPHSALAQGLGKPPAAWPASAACEEQQ